MDRLLSGFRMKTVLVLFLTLIMVAVGLQQAGEASAKKVLRIALDAADIKSLDPGFSHGTMDTAHHDLLYNGLLRFKTGDITVIEPDLAERYEISKDGMELTFYLRKGVMTHPFEGHPNGVEFTAEDVVFSLKKSGNPKFSTYSVTYQNFVPEAIDKYTVKVRLKKRLPGPERYFIDYRGAFMVPQKPFETIGAARFKTNPVGTGPFRLVKYVPGQKTVLAAHEKYFRGRPRLDGVEVWLMADVSSREFALRKGEVDVIEGVREQPWIDKMKKLPNVAVDVFGPGEINHLSFNVTKKPFDNPLVRRAMCYAISRDEIRTFIGRDASGPMCSVVPPFLPGGLSCEEVEKKGLLFKCDREKAKKLLAQAGYPNGFKMEQVITERASYRRATENLQSQFKKIGVDMKLKMVDHPTYHKMIRQGVNPYTMYICMRPNADIFLTWFFHSDSTVVTGKHPVTNFSHCTIIDDLVEKARVETDKEKQIRMWKQAGYKLMENNISYAMYVLRFVFARNEKVKWGYDQKTTLNLYTQITEVTDIK